MKIDYYLILAIGLFYSCRLFAQTPIDVAESTLKVGGLGEEVFYYGFAEGDQLVFNFQEVNGKELKEVEIMEMPSSSKFMDYKTTKIENKTINITTTGIYKFRFTNSAIVGRVCKFKIQRIPANVATKNFNTSVYTKTVYDTTYTDEQEKYLIKSDTSINNITDQVAKVHSYTNSEGSKTWFNFTLPVSTISWSYYIGVNQAGQDAFAEATKKVAKYASPLVAKIPGYGPLAALALNGASYLTSLQTGENVEYWFMTSENKNLWIAGQAFNYFKKGNVINDFSRMITPLNGTYFLCLYNDNNFQAIDVTVKITAVCVDKQFGTRNVKKPNVSSHKEQYLKNK